MNKDKIIKRLLIAFIILASTAVILIIMQVIRLVMDEVDAKNRVEEASSEEYNAFGTEKGTTEINMENASEAASENDDVKEITEEVSAGYGDNWVSSIATPADAAFKYKYHDFSYTSSTVYLKTADEVYDETLSRMESEGKEIVIEGDTGENGELLEPTVSIYNPLALTSLPDAGAPFDINAPQGGSTRDNTDMSESDQRAVAEAELDPVKQSTIFSTNMILVDLDTNEVVAERSSSDRMYPASMTKVLTAISMADYLTEEMLSTEYIMKEEEIQKTYDERFSAVGTTAGDILPARDLFYGMLVCSGADADYALTHMIAGEDEFLVDNMNFEAWRMGIGDTSHFTNVIGAFSEDNYSTAYDIAVIMSIAIQNPLILDAMSKRTYKTVPTQADPEGVDISNWFLRRIDTYETNGTVVAAKTGFLSEAGFCAVSYLETYSGKHYICVTCNSNSNWRTIYDHISVYRAFTK